MLVFWFCFVRHNSSLVWMVGITYVYIDIIFGFIGTFFFNPSLLLCWMFDHDCLNTCCFGCLICVFCICTCSAQLSLFHMERCSKKYTHYYDYYYYYYKGVMSHSDKGVCLESGRSWVQIPLAPGFFRGQVIPVTLKLALQWLPCQAPGIIYIYGRPGVSIL